MAEVRGKRAGEESGGAGSRGDNLKMYKKEEQDLVEKGEVIAISVGARMH